MLCRGSEVLREVAWVIFDEVSYILCCLAGIFTLQQCVFPSTMPE